MMQNVLVCIGGICQGGREQGVISVKYRAEILSAGRNLLSRIYTSFACHLQPVHSEPPTHLLCLQPSTNQETENMNEGHF